MKGNKKNTVTLWMAAAFAVCLSASAQNVTEARLQQACAALQRSPLAAAELQMLSSAAHSLTNSPALRSRAMAAYSLTFLMNGNTNAFERATQLLQSTFPEAARLITVTRSDAFVTCDTCTGTGIQMMLCPSCMGTGKCKACDGTGKKGSGACPACKGKGSCGMCAGKKKIETACPTCKGTRLVFKTNEKIRSNYDVLLTNIVSICQENVRFTEQFGLASRETDTGKRIALLKNLFQEFSHRADLGPAKDLLAQAVNTRNNQEALQLKKQEQEKSNRELEALRKLHDADTLDDLNRAIATLAAYLKDHPGTPAKMELQTLLDDLVAARNRKLLTRKIIYGLVSLFGVLFLITSLKPLLFKKKPDHFGPLPGMDKLDKSKYTDPLSLTSEESKARVKTKKARLSPPEDRTE